MTELEKYAHEHWKNATLCKECKWRKYAYYWCTAWGRYTDENGWCYKGEPRFKREVGK